MSDQSQTNNNPPMYAQLTPLDREQHRHLKLDTTRSAVSRVRGMNSIMVTLGEFADVAREYPIVFVRVGPQAANDAASAVAPLAVLGLRANDNLFIDGDRWIGHYTPAYLRRYPFAMARVDDKGTLAVCYDAKWEGFGTQAGEALFKPDGEPTEFTANALQFLEQYEQDIERTRQACEELVKLGLLRDMRFDATLASGEQLGVEGFLALDEEKFQQLDDATLLRLAKSGLLFLIDAHRISLGHMGRLAAKYPLPA